MELLGLRDPLVEAIAFHHKPGKCLDQQVGPVTAVHVADALAHEAREPNPSENGERLDTSQMDPALIVAIERFYPQGDIRDSGP